MSLVNSYPSVARLLPPVDGHTIGAALRQTRPLPGYAPGIQQLSCLALGGTFGDCGQAVCGALLTSAGVKHDRSPVELKGQAKIAFGLSSQ
jgi:hypothetical protein